MRWIPFLLAASLIAASGAEAQQPSAETPLESLNRKVAQAYGARDFKTAIAALQEMADLPAVRANSGQHAGVLYNIGCMYSLLGEQDAALAALRAAYAEGFTAYETWATDSDLDPLRGNAEFQALAAEIKRRFGPRPLAWDDGAPAPPFPLRFDEASAPGLAQLRSEFGIDAIVAGATTDLEKLVRLTAWTSDQWPHSNDQMASKSDPITILREAKAGGKFICRDYAIVVAGAARASGMLARLLAILPRDVETRSEAHSVAEVWLPALGKWVIADGQYGIVPELEGTPMSALELQRAIADEAPVVCRGHAERCAEWQRFIIRNLFYFKIGQDQRRFGAEPSPQLVLVPEGAAQPHTFAGNPAVFVGSIYTSNPRSFYASPL